ncbi:MAG: CoA transferase [bacterium]
MSRGALAGIRVVELGEGVSAAFCARLFADYGADVIKIEPPGRGDGTRTWGPFPADEPHPERSGTFFFLNNGKRSVALDLGSAADRERLLALVRDADVVIENLAPGALGALGLDHPRLAALNPRLVTISITPFGQSGPYAGWKGLDLNAYHLSGASHRYCGRPGEAPLEHGTFAADFFGAMTAASWGLAAVMGRERAGGGQHLDVSSAEAIAAAFVGGQNIGGYAQDGKWERRTGVGMPLGAPATILPCADGHVWMLALEPGQWNGLVKVMGEPEWAQLDMFQDMFQRAQNADVIYPFIDEWLADKSKFDVMERCQAAGVPVTAVFLVGEAAEQAHLKARGYLVEVEHPDLGRVRTLGAPFKLPASPGGPSRPAPRLGQHTGEILGSSAAIAADAAATPLAASSSAGATTSGLTAELPLSGIRVANFGWVWAGPVVGQTLGFLGADVLKIESRARIDMTRQLPPFGEGIRDPNRSLSNHACWAGQGSVTLNLKKPEARQLALDLIATCDVVVENFGPGVMNELDLGYETLRTVRPDLVMFSMPAAGLTGPLKDIRTYGLSLTSTTGLDSLVGYLGGPPIPVENAFSDPLNGIFGAFAILTALHHRDATGEGQHIDYSQQEAVMQLVGPAFMDWELNRREGGPLGNRHPRAMAAPHGVFPCAGDDHWIAIACEDDGAWKALVTAMGSPTWATTRDLASLAGRLAALETLHEGIATWTRTQEHRELANALQAQGVAATPVLSVADLLHDPHLKARGTFVNVVHPLGFEETIYGGYVKMSRTPAAVRTGPMLGQDNDRVFREILGLTEERYRALVESQVIF